MSDLSACGGWNQAGDAQVGQQVQKCLYGIRDGEGKSVGCWKCDEQYVALGRDFAKCVDKPAGKLEGCLFVDGETTLQCMACDFYAGYYMNTPGICKLSSSLY